MIELFDKRTDINYRQITLPQFVYLKGYLKKDLIKVESYYRNWVTSIKNEHLLVRLLLGLNVSFKRDIQNYVDVIGDNIGLFCNSLKITNSLGYGKVFTPGVFYGLNTTEIIVADETRFDVYEAYKHWRDLKPIRILRHPFTDLNMGLARGNEYESREYGIAVIAINVPMLALMYRAWCAYEAQQNREASYGVRHFIAMFVIPSMVSSHLDISLFNRMVSLYFKEDVASFHKAHSFFTTDRTAEVDDYLKKEIAILKKRRMTFDELLNIVPCVTSPTLYDLMRLPEVIPTRQVKWGLMIAQLPLLRFLLDIDHETDSGKNSYYLARLRTWLRIVRTDRVLENVLPLDVLNDIDNMIYRDIEKYL